MTNTLYLPELREMLEAENVAELREFCDALHPARTAVFLEGLDASETWAVISAAPVETRVLIFQYLDPDKQFQILTEQPRPEIAALVAEIPPDDRVDILQNLEPEVVADLLELMPVDERRDFLRLSQYPEGTAGAVMTTEVMKLSESLTINEALNQIGRESEEYETIYYLYIVDAEDHLRGLVSARQLLAGMKQPETRLHEIMDTDLVTVDVDEDQEEVANKVARMDLLAIPVVDAQHQMLGIITHDDVIDVVREEATEDAHRIAAVDPLDETYLRTSILTLSWKRGMWLAILFFFALLTAFALDRYESTLNNYGWLVFFIPLIISSGGNSGSQSATLIITALSRGHITIGDARQIFVREIAMGLLLGTGLALMGYLVSFGFDLGDNRQAMLVLPLTLLAVVMSGTLTGSLMPLLFESLGWDPAMMSNPFVAGIIDIVGILIYVNIAMMLL